MHIPGHKDNERNNEIFEPGEPDEHGDAAYSVGHINGLSTGDWHIRHFMQDLV